MSNRLSHVEFLELILQDELTELQDILQISKPTALGWIDRWEQRGRGGLEDLPRPGGPPLLDDQEIEIFQEELQRHSREPKRVLEAVKQRIGKSVSRSTLRRLARKLGFRWKRMRKSLRKRRDERHFRLAQEEIDELRLLPDLDVAFFDESAFSLSGVVPYGWQPTGVGEEVPVGARGSIQVLGIKEAEGETYGYLHRGTVRGTTVAEVLEDYSRRITRPTVLILDNASVHTCGLVHDRMEAWNQHGLHFYFLPTHSPELNDVERLWNQLKHQEEDKSITDLFLRKNRPHGELGHFGLRFDVDRNRFLPVDEHHKSPKAEKIAADVEVIEGVI